jgi:superfamily II DNA/RNA helicase
VNLQGKTLAFVLPILESVTNGKAKESNAKTKETNGNAKESRKGGYGGTPKPSVLVLLPTRELACQVGTAAICTCACIAGWMLFCCLLCVGCCALGEC